MKLPQKGQVRRMVPILRLTGNGRWTGPNRSSFSLLELDCLGAVTALERPKLPIGGLESCDIDKE